MTGLLAARPAVHATVARSVVRRGDPVRLSWRAEAVDEVVVEVRDRSDVRELVVDAGPGAGTVLVVLTETGRIRVTGRSGTAVVANHSTRTVLVLPARTSRPVEADLVRRRVPETLSPPDHPSVVPEPRPDDPLVEFLRRARASRSRRRSRT